MTNYPRQSLSDLLSRRRILMRQLREVDRELAMIRRRVAHELAEIAGGASAVPQWSAFRVRHTRLGRSVM